MKRAFTLIELLVVIAIIAALMGILIPSLSSVRERAKVLTVNSDLRQVGICLDMYMTDNAGKHPPTREDCALGWNDHQLPPELADGGYLPTASSASGMSAGIKDVFSPDNTYKYHAVGELYQNGRYSKRVKAFLYVPVGFPGPQEGDPRTDILYDDPAKSPVRWVVYSQGPKFDQWKLLKELNGPVARRSWYDSSTRRGLIVRMRMHNGDHRGSFEGR